MRYEAIFEDAPEILLIRQARSEQHIAYLKEHRNEILIGGGLGGGAWWRVCWWYVDF